MAKQGGKKKGGDPARIATNRRARHDYEVLDTLEAGIALLGPEVKSLREGKASLVDSYAVVRGGEVYLEDLHISPYEQARDKPEPRRERKLLLHRHEIHRLQGRVVEKGLTLIPLSLYWKEGRAKVELAVARGKKSVDKRETLKRREQEREMDRAVRGRRR